MGDGFTRSADDHGPSVVIRHALSHDIRVVRRLFREYAAGIGVDLSFQGFAAELASLPGRYARPGGRLLLAWQNDTALGCVALRAIDATTCEMKRLYVSPAARGRRLGRHLVERVCDEARLAGYRRIWLDTLPTMAPAIALYESLGFVPIEPYVYNPFEGARYLGLEL